MRKRLVIICVITGLLVAGILIWYCWPYKEYKVLKMRPDWDISENLVKGSDNKIFANALSHLGYTTFLHGPESYTVFVPTDKAYANLPSLTKNFLNQPTNSAYVRQVLLYHIIKGRYRYADLRDGMILKTVEGENITVTKKNGFFVLNNYAYIQTYDVVSKNGVIHIITNYLLPPSMTKK